MVMEQPTTSNRVSCTALCFCTQARTERGELQFFGDFFSCHPELGHGTTRHSLMAGVEHGHHRGAPVQELPLEHLPTHPSVLLSPQGNHPWKTRQLFSSSSHSVPALLTCLWQPYISAPSHANPISLFSCLIPRLCVALSSLRAN